MFSFAMATFSWFSKYVPTNSQTTAQCSSPLVHWIHHHCIGSSSLHHHHMMMEFSSFDKLYISFPNSMALLNNNDLTSKSPWFIIYIPELFNYCRRVFPLDSCIEDVISLFIRSKIVLRTLPISDFDGLINLNEGLCGRLSLWYLTITYASCFCNWSTLSLINSLSAIYFASRSTPLIFELVNFWYVLVVLSLKYFL